MMAEIAKKDTSRLTNHTVLAFLYFLCPTDDDLRYEYLRFGMGRGDGNDYDNDFDREWLTYDTRLWCNILTSLLPVDCSMIVCMKDGLRRCVVFRSGIKAAGRASLSATSAEIERPLTTVSISVSATESTLVFLWKLWARQV